MESCIQSRILKEFPELIHGSSTCAAESLSTNKKVEGAADRVKRRRAFVDAMEGKGRKIVLMWSEHGSKVGAVEEKHVTEEPKGEDFFDYPTDALITNVPNVVLFNSFADCLPVFFFDQKNKAIGLAHAGWRSLLGGVISNTIAAMAENYATAAADLRAWVAPSIHKCCFEIKEDVRPQFEQNKLSPANVLMCEGRMYVDLQELAHRQLVLAGVAVENIEISSECTCCQPEKYFSYRRDGRGGALGNAIGLKN